MKQNKSTVNSYNLISNHFYAKLKGMQNVRENSFEMMQNLNWSKSTRIQGEMIIQLQAAIFESEMSEYTLQWIR